MTYGPWPWTIVYRVEANEDHVDEYIYIIYIIA